MTEEQYYKRLEEIKSYWDTKTLFVRRIRALLIGMVIGTFLGVSIGLLISMLK